MKQGEQHRSFKSMHVSAKLQIDEASLASNGVDLFTYMYSINTINCKGGLGWSEQENVLHPLPVIVLVPVWLAGKCRAWHTNINPILHQCWSRLLPCMRLACIIFKVEACIRLGIASESQLFTIKLL